MPSTGCLISYESYVVVPWTPIYVALQKKCIYGADAAYMESKHSAPCLVISCNLICKFFYHTHTRPENAKPANGWPLPSCKDMLIMYQQVIVQWHYGKPAPAQINPTPKVNQINKCDDSHCTVSIWIKSGGGGDANLEGGRKFRKKQPYVKRYFTLWPGGPGVPGDRCFNGEICTKKCFWSLDSNAYILLQLHTLTCPWEVYFVKNTVFV